MPGAPAKTVFTPAACGLIGTLWFAWRGQDLSHPIR